MPVYEYNNFAYLTPANTSEATLLTLASGEELINAEVVITNKSAGDLTFRVGIGTGASPSIYYAYDMPLLANLYQRIVIAGLGSQNKIFVKSSSGNNIDFSVSGLKKTK